MKKLILKKLGLTICCALLVFSFSACGKDTAEGNDETAVVSENESNSEEVTEDPENSESDTDDTEDVEEEGTAKAGAEDEEEAEDNSDAELTIIAGTDPIVLINGQKVGVGSDMNLIEDSLGNPDSKESAPGCLDGTELEYVYGGIKLCTSATDSSNTIWKIEIDNGGTLANGIGVGSSLDALKDTYGDKLEIEDEFYASYTQDNVTIGFELDNNVVAFIDLINF